MALDPSILGRNSLYVMLAISAPTDLPGLRRKADRPSSPCDRGELIDQTIVLAHEQHLQRREVGVLGCSHVAGHELAVDDGQVVACRREQMTVSGAQ